MNRQSIWTSLGLLLLLAIAVATIWGFSAGYLVSLWEESTRSGVNEYLAIRFDGEPMIDSYTTAGGVYRELPQRSLDGKELPGPHLSQMQGATIPVPRRNRSWSDGPVTWGERIARMDGRGRWLVIHDGQPNGRAYLASYDLRTKLPTGYIGRKGFTLTPPAPEDQFAVGAPFSYGSTNLAGAGLFISNVRRYTAELNSATPVWCIFLLDGENLVEVDVNNRTVRTLIGSGGVEGFEIVPQPAPLSEEEIQQASRGEWGGTISKEVAELRLLVRLTDSIAVLNPAAGERTDFRLPEEFRTGRMTVYTLGDDELLFVSTRALNTEHAYNGPQHHTLTWLNNAGERVKEVEVDVGGYQGTSNRVSAIIAALVVPTLIFFGLVAFLFAPFTMLETGRAASYAEAFRDSMVEVWPAGLALLLVSLAAAWLVVRWQRKYDRPHTAAWAIAVFILGVPGLLAYMFQHGFPPRVPCPACGAAVPQRRDACAACRKPFPAPTLKGTEVFA